MNVFRMHMVMAVFCGLLAAGTVVAWELPEFMISTWGGPKIDDHDARARALTEAGLNTVMVEPDLIDVYAAQGLRIMVNHPTPETAARLRGNPNVWGYHITDEPDTDTLSAWADSAAAIRKADPTHPAYINQFARAGNHIDKFIEIVKPEVLSYDFYQWWYGDYQLWWEGDRGWFSRLEQNRDAALRAGIPLIIWIEAVANKSDERYSIAPMPSDSPPKVRQSVYTSLAYGVKGIQWYHGSMLYERESATLSEAGRHVRDINRELAAMGPTLLGLESVNVFHTPPLPRGSREAPLQYWVLPEGDDLVLGIFKGDDNFDYLMAVNRAVEHGNSATLVFQRDIERVEIFNRETGEWETMPLNIREDRPDAYNPDKITDFMGVPARTHDRLVHLRNINSYLPPFQTVEFMLEAGDGTLLRVISAK